MSWGDCNNDGYPDLYVGQNGVVGSLFVNDGDGTFSAGPAIGSGSRAAAWGDYDNDGDLDLNIALDGFLYRNDGGCTFTLQNGATIGFTGPTNLGDVGWIDQNEDGFLDIWAPDGGGNYIFQNDGDATFTSQGANGLGLTPSSNGETTVVTDYDGDGHTDILYRSTGVELWRSDGDGTYTNTTTTAGISLTGTSGGYNGTAFGDYDNDGDLDFYGGQAGVGGNKLYSNDGDGTFTDVTATAGVAGSASTTRGVAWGDYDNDGDLDLYVAHSDGANQLFENDGTGSFTDVAATYGLNDASASYGATWADFDLDGDLDLFVGSDTGASKLFRNDLNDTNYLKVKVTGGGAGYSPRDGTGSRVELWDETETTLLAVREITGGEGYGSHAPHIARFGVASDWPGDRGGGGTYTVKVKFTSGITVTKSKVVPTSESILVGATTLNNTVEIFEEPDHVMVTAADGKAGIGGTEVLSLQLVNQSGDAVGKALSVTVDVNLSATFSANDIGGTNGTNNLTGTLSASGAGSVTITDGVGETVAVSADATGDAQTAANVNANVTFGTPNLEQIHYRWRNDNGADYKILNIALVCNDAACTNPDRDVPLKNHLINTLGHTVSTFVDSDQTWTPTSYDVVVISESVGSSSTAWLKTEAVGIVTHEGSNEDEFELGSGSGESHGGGDNDVNIIDNTHYITQVFPLGVLTVSTVTTNSGWMDTWANDVTPLAHYSYDPGRAKLLYVDSGGVLAGGVNTAAERRVFYGAENFANLNANGITLFNRALDWAAHNESPTGVATYAEIQDTPLSGLAVQTVKRLRFEISNEGIGPANGITYVLEVSGPDPGPCGSATYNPVPTADWQIVDSADLTDGAATSPVTSGLADENTTFVSGVVKDAAPNSITGINLEWTEFTEIEYALQATTTATAGALYCFRLTNAGSTANFTYTEYAQVTMAVADLRQIHYRWRNDDGPEPDGGLDTGDGTDGALAPAGTFNLNTDTSGGRTYADGIAYQVLAPADGASSVTSSTDTLSNGITAGDEVLLINMQGVLNDTADVGNYEFLKVQSVTASTITFTTSITKSYDGTTAANQKVVVQRVPNYSSVTLDASDSVTASAWDGLTTAPAGAAGRLTGIVVFRTTGAVTVGAGTSIDVDGKGYRGGAGGTTGGGINGESSDGFVGSGGDDTDPPPVSGENPGTYGGGASSNYDVGPSPPAGGWPRGGGGGGGNTDGNTTGDGAGGGGGGGYGDGGGGGGGGSDGAFAGGVGGLGGTTSLPGLYAGGGGGQGGDNGAAGGGGPAGSPGVGTGNQGAAGSAVTNTGEGGGSYPGSLGFSGVGAGGGGGGGQYGAELLTTLFLGSGGGGGGGHDPPSGSATGKNGGAGGGIVFIVADSVTVSGNIRSGGENGQAAAAQEGAGGGGSGGSILIQANSASLGSSVSATGGSRGAPAVPGGGAGGGGVGRIRIESDSISGTTTPAASEGPAPGGGSGSVITHEETLPGSGAATNTVTVANVGSGTDQLYLAAVAIWGQNIAVSGTPPIDGGGLTWTLQKRQCAARLDEPFVEIWQAFGSPGATFSVTINLSGTADRVSAAVSRYSGADPIAPTEGANGSNAESQGLPAVCGPDVTHNDTDTMTLSLTSSRDNSVLYVASHPRNTTLATPDSNYAERAFISNSSGGDGANLYVHDRTLATAGSDTITHAIGSIRPWDMAGLVINPSLPTATWAAAEDTLLAGLATDTLKRLRLGVSNAGDAAASGTTYVLEVSGPDPTSCTAATYSAVPTDTSGHWQIVDSGYLTDGTVTTNVILDGGVSDPGGAFTFVDGQVKDAAPNQITGINLSKEEFTEIEYALKAITANATEGALYCFRLRNTGSGGVVSYDQYAQVRLLGVDHFVVEAVGGGSIGTQTAGMPFSIKITAQDVNNATWTNFTGTVEISSTGALSAGSGTTLAFAGGVLTSHSVTISNTGNFTITATKTSDTESGISNSFDVVAGAISQLVFITQPGTGAAGQALSTQPVVEVQDTLGNAVTTDPNGAATETVTVAFTTGTNGEGATLSGTLTVNINWTTGQATYTDVSVDLLGSYQLTATTNLGAYTVDSSAFSITAGPPSQLVFVTQPSNGEAGLALPTQPVVEVRDAGGNPITIDPDGGTTETVTVAFTAGTNGEGATLSGTLTVNINWTTGQATYTDLSVDLVGSYQLTASTNLGAFTVDSSAFSIIAPCGAVADAAYVAANAQNGQVTVYWSSADPVLILRQTAAFAGEVPADAQTYAVNDTVGAAATVVYNGSVAETSLIQPGLTNGTPYHYKVFPKQSGPCYAAGIEVDVRPEAGPDPAWSYMLAGGSILKAGIAGDGAIYTSSNASRIVSLNTTDGTQSWAPAATTNAIQGWLTWLPIFSGNVPRTALLYGRLDDSEFSGGTWTPPTKTGGNNGAYAGVDSQPGQMGEGRRFDATSEYVNIEADQNLDPAKGTVQFWYKPTYTAGTVTDAIILNVAEGDAASFVPHLVVAHTNGQVLSVVFQDASWTTVSEWESAWASAIWQANEWVHLRVTWDSSLATDNIHVYINGTEPTHTNNVQGPWTAWSWGVNDKIWVGNNSTTGSLHASGLIDELYVYGDVIAPSDTSWWNASWQRRIKISFQNGTGTEDLRDFPVVVSLTSADINYTETEDAGEDIRFVDADGTTELKYEIEKWDEAGTSVVWVKVPQVDAGSTIDHIWMYYNYDTPPATDNQDPAGVWSNGYIGVWHLHDDFLDSSPSGHNGTNSGSTDASPGKIADGQDFDGATAYIQTPSNELQTANEFTLSTWFRADSTAFAGHMIWQGISTGNGWGGGVDTCVGNEDEMHLTIGQITDANVQTSDVLSFYIGCTVSTPGNTLNVSTPLPGPGPTANYFVAVTVSDLAGTPTADLYLDGAWVAQDTGTVAGTPRTNWNTNLRMGGPGGASRLFSGLLDEVRISSVPRSAEWLRVSHVNQNSPSGFYTVGTPETASGEIVLGGDQGGKVYAVKTATGLKDWEISLTGADAVQAPTAAQVPDWSNAAFQAAYSDVVLFAPSRNGSTTSNKLFAIGASDGTVLWTFNQNGTDYNVDMIVGQPYVDYARNRVYIASHDNAGTQQSLWVIDTLNGALVACTGCTGLGDLETSPTLSFDGTTLYVGNKAGDLHAINADTLTLKWTFSLGAGADIRSFVWEDWGTPGRLYFTTADGNVRCVQDGGASASACTGWTPYTVAGVSTPILLDKLYVGSSDGNLYQLDLTNGACETQYTVGDGSAQVGDPSTETGSEIFVGMADGKLYKVPLPLPASACP